MWVNVGGHDLFLVGVGAYDPFFGYIWVSVTFSWLGVGAYGSV